MNNINYYRVTNCNRSIRGAIDGTDEHLSFEAGFYIDNDGGLILHGRCLDSKKIELISSCGERLELPEVNEKYKSWDPSNEIKNLVETIRAEEIITEPLEFCTPLVEMKWEIKGPIGMKNTLVVVFNVSQKYTVFGEHTLQDGGHLSVGMLIDREQFITFLENLSSDLKKLLERRAV